MWCKFGHVTFEMTTKVWQVPLGDAFPDGGDASVLEPLRAAPPTPLHLDRARYYTRAELHALLRQSWILYSGRAR